MSHQPGCEPGDQRYVPEYPHCPYFQATIELIGKRWTASILRALMRDDLRFSEIADVIPGLSNRLLSQRLSDLVDAGIIEASAETQRYHLTERGQDLERVMLEIDEWNRRWVRPHAVGHTAGGEH